jgi:hypothetical protein
MSDDSIGVTDVDVARGTGTHTTNPETGENGERRISPGVYLAARAGGWSLHQVQTGHDLLEEVPDAVSSFMLCRGEGLTNWVQPARSQTVRLLDGQARSERCSESH